MKRIEDIDDVELKRELMHRLRMCGRYIWFHTGEKGGQKRILMTLFKCGNMTQRELQDIMDIKSASLSEILAKIESDGLIERRKSVEDRRQIQIILTETGKKEAYGIEAENDRVAGELFHGLSRKEKQELFYLLDKLVEKWTKKGGDKN